MKPENHVQADCSEQGCLLARPGQSTTPGPTGLHALGLEHSGRDGLIYVPQSYRPGQPAPLAVLFHGAGGGARDGISLLQDYAEDAGLLLLAPDSRGHTWDVILGGYGPDVSYLDRALAHTFAHYQVDPARLAIGGFSDGASYALSLGITNGRFFTHIIAFSPGFMAPTDQRDLPLIFISHGTDDPILPIAACSRRIALALKQGGFNVRCREFEGGHAIPPEICREAVDWLGT